MPAPGAGGGTLAAASSSFGISVECIKIEDKPSAGNVKVDATSVSIIMPNHLPREGGKRNSIHVNDTTGSALNVFVNDIGVVKMHDKVEPISPLSAELLLEVKMMPDAVKDIKDDLVEAGDMNSNVLDADIIVTLPNELNYAGEFILKKINCGEHDQLIENKLSHDPPWHYFTDGKHLDDRPYKMNTKAHLCFQNTKFDADFSPTHCAEELRLASLQMSVGATHVHLEGHDAVSYWGMDWSDISSLYYLSSAHDEDDDLPPLEEYSDTYDIDTYMPEP